MGLFGIFGHKKKSSDQSMAPDIADLPPIPEQDASLDAPLPSDNSASSNTSLDSPSPDVSADPSSGDQTNMSMDLPDLPEESTVQPKTTQPNDSSNVDGLSEISPDHPLPDLSEKDLSPDFQAPSNLTEDSSEPVTADAVQETKPLQSEPAAQQESVPKANQTSESVSQQVQTPAAQPQTPPAPKPEVKEKSSLPVFNEVAVPTAEDVESLTISELFIKREQYGELLKTLHTTRKELDALIKKSALAKPNEKIGLLLKKATTKHAELNKSLLFVEENLVE